MYILAWYFILKKFEGVILSAVIITLIVTSAQAVFAEDITETLKPVPIRNSEYKFHLQVVLRDSDGGLISVTESTNGYYIPHKITDEAFDFHFGTKEIVTIENPINNKTMIWVDNTFTKNNFPGPDFQKEQKKESIKYILQLY